MQAYAHIYMSIYNRVDDSVKNLNITTTYFKGGF